MLVAGSFQSLSRQTVSGGSLSWKRPHVRGVVSSMPRGPFCGRFRPNYPRRLVNGTGDLAAGLWAAGDNASNRHPRQLCLGEGGGLLCPFRCSSPAPQRPPATGAVRYNAHSTRPCRCPPHLGSRWRPLLGSCFRFPSRAAGSMQLAPGQLHANEKKGT